MPPAVNAALNATSAVLLCAGYACIRTKHVAAHVVCMVSACAVSAAFLVSYLAYHARAGMTHFAGGGGLRFLYVTILISHTVLAVVIVPMVIRTLVLAGARRFEAHRRFARLTLPVWLYVSVTGVVVYAMLYRMK